MSTENTFIEFLNELKEVNEKIAELESLREAIRDTIKDELTANGLDELQVGNYHLTYREVVQSRFNSTAFKKSHLDLYNKFVSTNTFKRLTVN